MVTMSNSGHYTGLAIVILAVLNAIHASYNSLLEMNEQCSSGRQAVSSRTFCTSGVERLISLDTYGEERFRAAQASYDLPSGSRSIYCRIRFASYLGARQGGSRFDHYSGGTCPLNLLRTPIDTS